MGSPSDLNAEITPQVLLKAYSCGIFPMAESALDNSLFWVEPELRGILPLNAVHVPRRLARTIRSRRFEIRVDTHYHGVIDGCAGSRPGRRTTWINPQIRRLYAQLFEMGHCHTIEAWIGNDLVGGLYGVELGRAFFGESMFSYERDASKVALIYLMARLIRGGFTLLDTQFVTEHLQTFGAREIGREKFQVLLADALQGKANFRALQVDHPPEGVLQLVNQTSNTGCSTP